jgi:4-amino-4-deoxy-L-arabinose transferase-like glycosyltransferase
MPYKRAYVTATLLLALLAYFWGLGSVQIPKIGDEVLYLQIARVTGESGSWLPLRYEAGVFSTKPPLLYWLGIMSTRLLGESLLAYRLPVLFITFLGALLLYLLAKKYLKDPLNAIWAVAVYLGFISTYQHGRPFLVNSFEVLFLLLPLLCFFYWPRMSKLNWILCALSWGAVAWSKSFALIGVGFFSLSWATHYLLPTERFWKRILYFGSAAIVSLGIFGLWFVFDPDPALLFNQFIIGENAEKFKGYAQYFAGLFTGSYTLFRIWLGPIANAGLYAFPMVGLLYFLFSNRKHFSDSMKALIVFTLAFLIFYSLPTQRQENYLLPTMAVFAIILARYKDHVPQIVWRASRIVLDLCFLLLSFAPIALKLLGQFSVTALILWGFCILVYPFIYFLWGEKFGYPLFVFLCYIQLTNFSEPFNQHFNYFLQNRDEKVWVPNRRLASYERFRFVAPGSVPQPYAPAEAFDDKCSVPLAGELMILEEEDLAKCSRRYETLEEVRDFKTRQSPSEILKIAAGDSTYLVRKLVLVKFL